MSVWISEFWGWSCLCKCSVSHSKRWNEWHINDADITSRTFSDNTLIFLGTSKCPLSLANSYWLKWWPCLANLFNFRIIISFTINFSAIDFGENIFGEINFGGISAIHRISTEIRQLKNWLTENFGMK